MRRGYAAGRLIQFVVVLWGAATLNFFIPRLGTGDPVRQRLLLMTRSGGVSELGSSDGAASSSPFCPRSYHSRNAARVPGADVGSNTMRS